MALLQSLTEALARRTTRRGLLSHGADAAFGTLAGVAAGTLSGGSIASARHTADHTACGFPGPPCPCDGCVRTDEGSNGICAKPCNFLTTFYASGCWVIDRIDGGITTTVTCCDCDCNGYGGLNACGCGSDYHSNTMFCV